MRSSLGDRSLRLTLSQSGKAANHVPQHPSCVFSLKINRAADMLQLSSQPAEVL